MLLESHSCLSSRDLPSGSQQGAFTSMPVEFNDFGLPLFKGHTLPKYTAGPVSSGSGSPQAPSTPPNAPVPSQTPVYSKLWSGTHYLITVLHQNEIALNLETAFIPIGPQP